MAGFVAVPDHLARCLVGFANQVERLGVSAPEFEEAKAKTNRAPGAQLEALFGTERVDKLIGGVSRNLETLRNR